MAFFFNKTFYSNLNLKLKVFKMCTREIISCKVEINFVGWKSNLVFSRIKIWPVEDSVVLLDTFSVCVEKVSNT